MENNKIIYLSIPNKYYNLYQKLLNALADFGKQIIDECNNNKFTSISTVLNCWHLFQSALACIELGDTNKGEFFMDYIDKQLNIVYKNNVIIDKPDGNFPEVPINPLATRLYIGANDNDTLDFNIKDLTEFVAEDDINGNYTVKVESDSAYIWICIPTIYDNSYISLDSFRLSTISPIQVFVDINNTTIEYNCYRSTHKMNKNIYNIEITNL